MLYRKLVVEALLSVVENQIAVRDPPPPQPATPPYIRCIRRIDSLYRSLVVEALLSVVEEEVAVRILAQHIAIRASSSL